MNACDRFEWLLPALVDGDEDAAVHLRECAGCAAEWRAAESLLGEIAAGEPLGPSPDLRPAVLARVNRLPRAGRAWLPYAVAASLLVGAVAIPLARGRAGAVTPLSAASAATPLAAPAADDFSDALFAGLDGADGGSDLESRLVSGLAAAHPESPSL